MLNPQLTEQIAHFKERKAPRAQVQAALVQAGWMEADVEAALKKIRYPAYVKKSAAGTAEVQATEAERAAEALLAAERERSGRRLERQEVLHDAAAGAVLPPPVGIIFQMRALARLGISPLVFGLVTAGLLILGLVVPAAASLAGLIWSLQVLYLGYHRYVRDV